MIGKTRRGAGRFLWVMRGCAIMLHAKLTTADTASPKLGGRYLRKLLHGEVFISQLLKVRRRVNWAALFISWRIENTDESNLKNAHT
jgi:hypothetical protein